MDNTYIICRGGGGGGGEGGRSKSEPEFFNF